MTRPANTPSPDRLHTFDQRWQFLFSAGLIAQTIGFLAMLLSRWLPALSAVYMFGVLIGFAAMLCAAYNKVRLERGLRALANVNDGVHCPACYYPPDNPADTFRCTECGTRWPTDAVREYFTSHKSVAKPTPLPDGE